jgi:DNA-directed RNA polymerase subunit beta'
MMSTNNILHPANGAPIIVPSQDIVLGLYYLSIVSDGEPGQGKAFADIGEIEHALAEKVISLHTKIKLSLEGPRRGRRARHADLRDHARPR